MTSNQLTPKQRRFPFYHDLPPLIWDFLRSVWLIWILLGMPSLAWAQRPLVESPTTLMVREAAQQLEEGKWLEALEQLQRILETAGEDLVFVNDQHGIAARWVCHQYLARLPAEGLELYRKRVESGARQRLEMAKKNRQPKLLKQILAETFCSRSAEEAILLLAEHHLERGQLDLADFYWNLLQKPNPSAKGFDDPPFQLTYPDPKTPLADILARKALLALFQGSSEAFASALQQLQKSFPEATGTLAGQRGKYVDLLQMMNKSPEKYRLVPRPDQPGWNDFAYSSSRNSCYVGPLPRYWPDTPAWQMAIPNEPSAPRKREEIRSASMDHPRSLAFHPIIWDDHVLINDAGRIMAFHLLTGKPATLFTQQNQPQTMFDVAKELRIGRLELDTPPRLDVRYTLSRQQDYLFARLGSIRFDLGNLPENDREESVVVCLKKEANTGRFAKQWILIPPTEKEAAIYQWEGSPVVIEDRIYMGYWKQRGGDAVSGVACYQFLSQEEPQLIWQQEIGKGALDPTTSGRHKAEVLLSAGSNIVCLTPRGSCVALDHLTGKPQWEFRYPKRDKERKCEAIWGRDLCPLLYDAGKIFLAPTDADRVFGVNAFTGKPIWESRPLEVIHLLGVSKNRLICTLDRPLRGIAGLNIHTGSELLPDGWMQTEGDGLITAGRGFVSPEWIFWPTKQGLYILRSEDGTTNQLPIQTRDSFNSLQAWGNLSFGNDCLVVATPTQLWGFVPDKRYLEQRRQELEQAPKDGVKIFQLALAEADAGLLPQAIQHWQQIQTNPTLGRFSLRGQPLAELAQQQIQQVQRQFPNHLVQIQRVSTNTVGSILKERSGFVLLQPPSSGSWSIPQVLGNLSLSQLSWIDSSKGTIELLLGNREQQILCGKHQIVCWKQGQANPIWSVSVEAMDPSNRSGFFHKEVVASQFHAYRRLGNRLFVMIDSTRLICLELETGKILWQHWAGSERSLPGPSAFRFDPYYLVTADRVILKLQKGPVQILEGTTGKSLLQIAGGEHPWMQDPLAISETDVLLAPNIETIVRLNLLTLKPTWKRTLPGWSNLAGVMPWLHRAGPFLLLGIQRNIGPELACWQIDDGSPAWGEPRLFSDSGVDFASLQTDAEQYYLLTDSGLIANSLVTSRTIWTYQLDSVAEHNWKFQLRNNRLFLFPTAIPAPPFQPTLSLQWHPNTWTRRNLIRFTFQLRNYLQARTHRPWTLEALDPQLGRAIQEWTFPTDRTNIQIQFLSDAIVIQSGPEIWTWLDRKGK